MNNEIKFNSVQSGNIKITPNFKHKRLFVMDIINTGDRVILTTGDIENLKIAIELLEDYSDYTKE